MRFLSSHCSLFVRIPFPQTSLHTVGVSVLAFVQFQPAVTLQSLHPSRSFIFPSSHSSVPRSFPSPQTVKQSPPTLGQTQPDVIWHVALQPSFGFKLESSHSSPDCNTPSPQRLQTLGRPTHVQP